MADDHKHRVQDHLIVLKSDDKTASWTLVYNNSASVNSNDQRTITNTWSIADDVI